MTLTWVASFSRVLNGRTRTATLTLSAPPAAAGGAPSADCGFFTAEDGFEDISGFFFFTLVVFHLIPTVYVHFYLSFAEKSC
jgi:hypothetical protein